VRGQAEYHNKPRQAYISSSPLYHHWRHGNTTQTEINKWNKFVLQERKLIGQWDKQPGKLIHVKYGYEIEHIPAKFDKTTGKVYFLRPVHIYPGHYTSDFLEWTPNN
jgi:hypothetical protein